MAGVVFQREAAAVLAVDHAIDPHVPGEGVHPVVAEEHHAAGHLDAHPGQRHQPLKQRGVIQQGERGQIHLAPRDQPGGVQHIAAAVPKAAGVEPLQAGLRQGAGRREGAEPALSGRPKLSHSARTQRRMAGMLLRWLMMKHISVSKGSCRSILSPPA